MKVFDKSTSIVLIILLLFGSCVTPDPNKSEDGEKTIRVLEKFSEKEMERFAYEVLDKLNQYWLASGNFKVFINKPFEALSESSKIYSSDFSTDYSAKLDYSMSSSGIPSYRLWLNLEQSSEFSKVGISSVIQEVFFDYLKYSKYSGFIEEVMANSETKKEELKDPYLKYLEETETLPEEVFDYDETLQKSFVVYSSLHLFKYKVTDLKIMYNLYDEFSESLLSYLSKSSFDKHPVSNRFMYFELDFFSNFYMEDARKY